MFYRTISDGRRPSALPCVSACPVDAIHPRETDEEYKATRRVYIDPVECVACSDCEPVCPVNAIFAPKDLPAKWVGQIEVNANFFHKQHGEALSHMEQRSVEAEQPGPSEEHTAQTITEAAAHLKWKTKPHSVERKVKEIVVEQLGSDEWKVVPAASFVDDLGADSLDIKELVMAFEEAFELEIPDGEAENLATIKDAVHYIKIHVKHKHNRSSRIGPS